MTHEHAGHHQTPSAWASMSEADAYALLARSDANTQWNILTGTGPDNAQANAVHLALIRSGMTPGAVNDFINARGAASYGQPVALGWDGNALASLVAPAYVPRGPKPTHGGKHSGKSEGDPPFGTPGGFSPPK